MPLLFLHLHVEPNRAKYIQVYTGLYTRVYIQGCVSICMWNHLRCTIYRSFCGLNSTWFQCTCNGVHMTSSRCNHDCMALSSPCWIHKLAMRCWCCAQSMYCSNMNTPITKEQIKNLLSNVYGFMSRCNTLCFCPPSYAREESFDLFDIDGDCIEFTYNNATVCNGSVTFEQLDGLKLRLFTILVVPTDGSGLMPQILNT